MRERQAELARSHGIYGFCYYFYWFGGRRLLETPLALMLQDGAPDLPFCLCWANEPWSRRWDGRERDVLMPQHHDRVRDLAILDDLMPFFENERYIRIDGRPLVLVYRQGLLDDARRFTADLRAEAVRRGLPGLFLGNVMSIGDDERVAAGFDAAVEFPPNGILVTEIDPRTLGADPAFRGRVYDYPSVVSSAVARPTPLFAYFPGVMPRWDNSARKNMAAQVFHGSTPELFERWLRHASLISTQRSPAAPLVFVNSWNEWAEGAHLEPDEQTGNSYLEAVRRVVMDGGDETPEPEEHASAGSPAPATTDGTALELRPGLPDGVVAMEWVAATGAGWIDSVDGRPLQGHVVRARPHRILRLHGWFYADSRRSGRLGAKAYLVLTSDSGVWHAPIRERHRRADLQRAMLARDRRTRRLVRAIDRLPAAIGRPIRHLWASRDDYFGFEVRLEVGQLPAGRYHVAFLDVETPPPQHVPTEFELLVK